MNAHIATLQARAATIDANLAALQSYVRRLEWRRDVVRTKRETDAGLDELMTQKLELDERLRKSDDWCQDAQQRWQLSFALCE